MDKKPVNEIMSEDLGNGMFRSWHFDKRLFVLKGTRNARSAADTWGRAMREAIEMWDTSRPFLAVHDFRIIGMTPYNRKIAIETCRLFPADFFGRYVIIVGRGVIGYGLKYFGERDLKRLMPQFDGQVVFDYDAGFQWVADALDFKSNDG